MANEANQREADAAEAVRPGTLTGILAQIAQTPEVSLGQRWDEWLRPGAVLADRFELVREIGRGGFGIVWEARDRQLGRNVAFKAVRAGDRTALREERLVREAEAAARLSHPNIVTLHDVGRSEHGPYLVLELLRGQTLADRLDQGPIPLREALRIGVEIARGLAHAHAEGVVHRDLKPENVFLLEDGQVKLLDFGLAHALGRRRQDGGTPAYMAPEQWRGAPEDERTDVFALGVLLFRMLSGELPFPDDADGKAAQASRPAPALDVPEVPAVGALVARMLKKDPVERPRDGAAVLAALSAFQRELDRTPSSPSAPVRARRGAPGRTVALGVAAAALAIAAIVAALLAVRPWRWLPGADPGGPITVAVADFANQTGEPELDGLSGMLITSLEQSQRLSVLTRVRMLDVLRQMGKTDVTSVDEALGRELALSAGVRALVVASIRRFDQLYAIELKVLDPVKSEYLFTLKEDGRGKASVPAMIDRLSEATRQRLRESPAEVQASNVKVADLTTSSLEAYQHYFRGEQLKEGIRYEPAVEAYRRAIAVDPNFALAHYRLAYLGKFTGMDEGERKAHMDAALRAADRVPAKERVLIQAWKAVMDGRSQDAHRLYERAVEAYPQDKEVLFMAGDQYIHEEEWTKALPYMQRSVALDPTFEPALMHLTDSLAALDRTAELTDAAKRWTERAPSAPGFRALTMAYGLTGRVDDAVAAARRALELDGTGYSRSALAEALILAERYAEAEALVRPYATPAASRLDRSFHVPSLMNALAYQGRRREALRAVDDFPEEMEGKRGVRHALKLSLVMGDGPSDAVLREERALARDADPHVTKGVAIALAWLGNLDGAAQAAAALPPEMRPAYDVAVAYRRGDLPRALALARELVKSPGHDGRALALWMLTRVAFDAGKDDEVVEAADALRKVPSDTWRTWGLPDAQLHAAQALERKGERAKARARVDSVLATWKNADPDLPMLAKAKELRARLGR